MQISLNKGDVVTIDGKDMRVNVSDTLDVSPVVKVIKKAEVVKKTEAKPEPKSKKK